MRNILLILVVTALSISTAAADPFAPQKPAKAATPDKPLPVKRSGDANSCAAYGPGFVKVAGSDTCVKLGGAVSVGVTSGR
jgi:predicted secreted protein